MKIAEAVLDTGAVLHRFGFLPASRTQVDVDHGIAADAVLDQLLEFAARRYDNDVLAAQLLAFDLASGVSLWMPSSGMAETITRVLVEHPTLEVAQAATIALANMLAMPVITTNAGLPALGTVIVLR